MYRNPGPNTGPNSSFVNGDPVTGTPATIPDGPWWTEFCEELYGFIERQGISLLQGQQDQLETAILGALSPQGLRNANINSGMMIWQRGSFFTLNGVGQNRYCADRWLSSSGDGVCNVERRQFSTTNIGSAVPGGSHRYLRHTQTGPATSSNPWVQQRIEDVRSFAGDTVNIAFYARVSSGTLTVTPEMVQNFGSGGSASVQTTGTNQTVTSTWARYDATITLPNLAGKIIGTNDFVNCRLTLPTGSTYTLDVVWIEATRGAVARPTEVRPLPVELMMAQRYFQKSYQMDTDPGTNTGAGVRAGHDASGPNIQPLQTVLPVRMRATPTVVWYAPSGAINNVEINQGGAQNVAVNGQSDRGETSSGYPLCNAYSSGASPVRAHYTCEAEL